MRSHGDPGIGLALECDAARDEVEVGLVALPSRDPGAELARHVRNEHFRRSHVAFYEFRSSPNQDAVLTHSEDDDPAWVALYGAANVSKGAESMAVVIVDEEQVAAPRPLDA